MNRNLKTASIALSLCGLLMSSSVVHADASTLTRRQDFSFTNFGASQLSQKRPTSWLGLDDEDMKAEIYNFVSNAFDGDKQQKTAVVSVEPIFASELSSDDDEEWYGWQGNRAVRSEHSYETIGPIYDEIGEDALQGVSARPTGLNHSHIPANPVRGVEEKPAQIFHSSPSLSATPRGKVVKNEWEDYVAVKTQKYGKQAADGVLWAGKNILKAGVWGAGKILKGAAYGVGKSVQWLWKRHKDSNIIDQERERGYNTVFDALAAGKTPVSQGSAVKAAWQGITQKIKDPTQKPNWSPVNDCLPLNNPSRIGWLKKTPSTARIVQSLVDRLSKDKVSNIAKQLTEFAGPKNLDKKAFRFSSPLLRWNASWFTQSARTKVSKPLTKALQPRGWDWMRSIFHVGQNKAWQDKGALRVKLADKLFQTRVLDPEQLAEIRDAWGKKIVVDSNPFYSVEVRA